MIRIMITGYGRMGKMIEEVVEEREDMEIVKKVDMDNVHCLSSGKKTADVIIDFSHPEMTIKAAEYAAATGTPLLTGTTGGREEMDRALRLLAAAVPVGASSNYSYGIAILKRTLRDLAAALKDWDMELVEAHHNKKADAPSGTAISLLALMDPDGEMDRIYGREGLTGGRSGKEIGVHSIRGGTEPGEHTIYFLGKDETITLSHRAQSRRIFAEGAVRAAQALVSKPAGLYTAEELFGIE